MDYLLIEESEARKMYDEFLDESIVEINGLTFDPSRIVSTLDPISYKIGFFKYAESLMKKNIYVVDITDDEIEDTGEIIEDRGDNIFTFKPNK